MMVIVAKYMYSTSKYNNFDDIIIASLFMKAELRSIKLIMHAYLFIEN